VRHREKWKLALNCLDELAADAGYGDSAEFRQGLTDRGLGLGRRGDADREEVSAADPCTGVGRRPVPAYPDPPSSLKALVLAAGRGALRRVTWRRGTHKTLSNPEGNTPWNRP
jgi:SRSO17 transposase